MTRFKKTPPDVLQANRGVLKDRSGGWFAGEAVYSHGNDLLRDMVPNKSYFHVLYLNVMGKLPNDNFCKWLEAIYICLSWPDPRIWCNGVGSFAGSAGTSPVAATAAGMLASDSPMYGPQALIHIARYFQYLKMEMERGVGVKELVEKEIDKTGGQVHMAGFARPIAKGDERVEAMLKYASDLGFEVGNYVGMGLEIERYLVERYDESINVGGYISAFMLDQELTPDDIGMLTPSLVNSGVTACYREDRDKQPECFLPWRCDDVEYTGPASRTVPDYQSGN